MNIYGVSCRMKPLLLVAALLLGSAGAHAEVVVLGEANFDSGVIPNSNGWGFGAQSGGQVSVSKDASANLNGSAGSLKGTYPLPTGGIYVWGGFDIAERNLNDVYISFWAKMPQAKQGLKFLKVFGQRDGESYANTTFGLDYTGVDYGGMYCVSFGDGSTIGNDTANVIFFDGAYPDWVGRSSKTAVVSTPQKRMWSSSSWGTSWHHFRIHIKFNTGTTAANQVADGEYYVEIDGKIYVDAKNIFNRHYSNKPIQKISFFDWAQSGSSAFEIWYDDIKITTGGFYDKNPIPPLQPSLIIK